MWAVQIWPPRHPKISKFTIQLTQTTCLIGVFDIGILILYGSGHFIATETLRVLSLGTDKPLTFIFQTGSDPHAL